MGISTKQQKDDQVMDAKTKKAAEDVKKRDTEENRGFRESILNAITPEFLKKQKKKNKDLEDVAKDLRCGGRVHKKAEGGMLKTPDNTGLKKLPESVRNNMGYMKKGGKVKKGYHRMPDGKVMKDSAHKKQSKCKRDGICVRGKTKGRMV